MRADFFGPGGDTTANRQRLEATCERYTHHHLDVRDRPAIDDLFRSGRYELVIHAAAQPSHDLAASRPFDDFEVNATGTLNLLEAARRHTPDAVFITVSTNKVYGDNPNRVPLEELDTRWDYADPAMAEGIDETMSLDHCTHSVFGASKVAADVLTQEYGRYFGLRTGTFRGGCLTGPHHAGVELHGFLSYLVLTALREGPYTIYGYKGKQVRDQIHSADVISRVLGLRPGPAARRGLQPRGRQGQRREPARVRRPGGRRLRREAAGAHLRRSGPRRGPHLLLLRHGQVPGPLPRLASGVRPPRHRRGDGGRGGGAARVELDLAMRLTLVNQFYAPDISPTAQLAASLAEHRAAQGRPRHHRHGPGRLPRRPRAHRGRAHGPRAADPPRVDTRSRQVVTCSPAARLRHLLPRRRPPAPPAAAPGRHRRDDDPTVRAAHRRAPPPRPSAHADRALEHGLLPGCGGALRRALHGGRGGDGPPPPQPLAVPSRRRRRGPRRGHGRSCSRRSTPGPTTAPASR